MRQQDVATASWCMMGQTAAGRASSPAAALWLLLRRLQLGGLMLGTASGSQAST